MNIRRFYCTPIVNLQLLSNGQCHTKEIKKTRKLYYLREPHGVQTKLKLTIIGVAVNPLILVPH